MESRYELAKRFMDALGGVNRSTRKMRITGMLPRGMFDILAVVDAKNRFGGENKVKIGAICCILQRSMPSVTRSVNELEDAGLIKKELSKEDRRMVYVSLTEKGNHEMEASMQAILDTVGIVLDKLGKQDAERLIGLLDKVSEIAVNMEKERSDD